MGEDLVLARVHSDLEGLLAIDSSVAVVGEVALVYRCRGCAVVELKFAEDRIDVDICLGTELEEIEMPFQMTVSLIPQMVSNTILTNINISSMRGITVRAANKSVTNAAGSTHNQFWLRGREYRS